MKLSHFVSFTTKIFRFTKLLQLPNWQWRHIYHTIAPVNGIFTGSVVEVGGGHGGEVAGAGDLAGDVAGDGDG
jgi:hypothetical protein